MANVDRVLLEDVFKKQGIPTYTFVEPREYKRMVVALRTPGRGLIVEGPSGIGKTSSLTRALEELGLRTGDDAVRFLSARKREDAEAIRSLLDGASSGQFVVDDFHKLSSTQKGELANLLKVLADEERKDMKLILVGINKAGESLVKLEPDVLHRVETITFEAEPTEKITMLLEKGEEALNVSINVKGEIAQEAQGSFYLAQLLAHTSCLEAEVLEKAEESQETNLSFESVKTVLFRQMQPRFWQICLDFAKGKRARPEGRAPYLHLLKWLAESDDWKVDIRSSLTQRPEFKNSVRQVVDNGYLREILRDKQELSTVLHFDSDTQALTVEDPQFVYFLRNISWQELAHGIGYKSIEFRRRYDVALSFAGADRGIAERLYAELSERELEVFYDKNEQHRIAGQDVELYLGPIYRSEAILVLCIISPSYPKNYWTKFEASEFRARLPMGEVWQLWHNAVPDVFGDAGDRGGFTLDDDEMEKSLSLVVDAVAKYFEETDNER